MEFKYISFRKMPFCRFMHSMRENTDLKHRQRNRWQRRFETKLGQGFCFRQGTWSLSSAASQTDNAFFFAKNFVLLQSCYGIQRPL